MYCLSIGWCIGKCPLYRGVLYSECPLSEVPLLQLCVDGCRIDAHFLIKITDFGLSEDVFVRNYFRQGSAGEVVKLPVKWMAPESLSDGHFSEISDVVRNVYICSYIGWLCQK